ncbi:hypothetical protein, partial [Halopelagius longus]|uniref:hypothetical protein n=1 Tax=Halopelagius longus TaxID=1236180 RepID=UPI001C31D32E
MTRGLVAELSSTDIAKFCDRRLNCQRKIIEGIIKPFFDSVEFYFSSMVDASTVASASSMVDASTVASASSM